MAVKLKKQPKSMKLNTNKRKMIISSYLFIAPAMILFALFFYYPMLRAFFYSLTDYNALSTMRWAGLSNYKRLFTDQDFIKAVTNTLKYLLIIVPSLVVLPLLLAQLVNQKLKGMYLFRLLFYMPYVTSTVAVSIVWGFLYHPEGLVNSILKLMGFFQNSAAPNWLIDSKTALFAVAIVEIWKTMGYYMIIYLAALQSVPGELYESACLDGARSYQVMMKITIPCIRPQILVVSILSTISAIKIFDSIYMMTQGGPLNSTLSLSMYIYQQGFVNLELGYASAIGVVLWLALVALSLLNFKLNARRD